jgi:hypothetical protein
MGHELLEHIRYSHARQNQVVDLQSLAQAASPCTLLQHRFALVKT